MAWLNKVQDLTLNDSDTYKKNMDLTTGKFIEQPPGAT